MLFIGGVKNVAADNEQPILQPPTGQRNNFKADLFTGSATENYPITVPKGTNDLTPSVNLSYSSQGSRDYTQRAGAGWQLDQDFVERDVNFTPGDTGDDKFKLTLQGKSYELVYVSGESRFHTKIESQLNIKKLTSSPDNDDGDYWQVITPNGTKYRFGYKSNSELSCSNRSYVTRWNLDQVTDIHSNHIYYTYVEDSNVARLSRIDYNTEMSRAVVFSYGSTSYSRPVYSQGCDMDETQKLNGITTIVDNTTVKYYDLSYSTATNGQQLLHTVTEKNDASGSALPATTFNYNSIVQSWHSPKETWISNQNMNYSRFDNADTRLIDVNGDNLPDIVRTTFNGSNTNYFVYKNTGTSWNTTYETWVNYAAIDAPLSQSNVKLVDVNGDGLPDIVKTTNSGTNVNWYVYKNTGTSWNTTAETWVNYANIDARLDLTNVTLSDVNGDGLVDIVKAYPDSSDDVWQVYLNTGSSWSTTGVVWIDSAITARIEMTNVRLVDVNGDGLADIVKTTNSGGYVSWYVYKNTGSSWSTTAQTWINNANIDTSIDNPNTRLIDVNGDGLPDIVKSYEGPTSAHYTWKVFLNLGNSWSTSFTNWYYDLGGEGTFLLSNVDNSIADVNGDGLADIVVTYKGSSDNDSVWEVLKNEGYAPNLLSSVTTSLGGQISFEYTPSPSYDNTGADSTSDLPFVLWVVDKMTVDNGMSGTPHTSDETDYSYQDGLYDYQDREFRGFATVNTTEPNGSKKIYTFNQDDIYKGLPAAEQTNDSSNNPYAKKENTWSNSSSNGVYTIKLDSEKNYTYDGSGSSPKINETDYTYDSYGNITKKSELGDTGTGADNRYTYNEYTVNTTDWILNTPKHTYLNASNDSTKVSESWFYYDTHTNNNDAPTKGDMTKQTDWLSGGTNPSKTFAYDSYGNVTSQTDANSHTTSYAFGSNDTTYTYPDSTTNAKSQTTTTDYDLATGNLLSTTDPNSLTTSYTYDVFGRVTKEIKPYDNSTYPTLSYTYSFDGTAPESTLVSKRKVSGSSGTYNVYTHIDGLGRKIQTRSDAEDTSKQTVVDTQYDHNGQVHLETVPHLDTLSTSFATPLTSIRNTTNSYDALGRLIGITNPDSTTKAIAYDHWVVTNTDERSHQKKNYNNAFGKISKVDEINGASTYSTTYEYSSTNLLTKITDNASHDTTLSYDTLGRKTSQTDPDLGTWSYGYDAAGNMTSQTDNRSVTVAKTYDELNRLTLTNYPSDTDSSYTYDSGKIGILSSVTDSAGSVSYTYDNRLRKTQEARTVSGATKTTQFSYDAADRTVTQTNPDGEVITNTFNAQGEIESVAGSATILSNIDYNALGKITTKAFGNGLTTNYTYNSTDFRLNRIQTGSLQDLNYTYDDTGNVHTIVDSVNSKTRTFGYDSLNRLTDASETSGFNQSYEYNSIGNLTKLTGDTTIDYTYGANGKAHAMTSSTEAMVPKTSADPTPTVFSLTDDWSSGSINSSNWDNWGSSHVTVSSQQLNMTSTTASGYYGVDSGVSGKVYNLTNAQIVNKLVNAGNQSITSLEVYPLYLTDSTNSNNAYFWLVSGNTVKAYKKVSGTSTQLASTTYNSTNHKYFRIRESSRTVYFDTSADGTTWTNFTSTGDAFDASSMIVGNEIGTWQTEGSTTTAIFDNISISTPPTFAQSDSWSSGSINSSKWNNWSSGHASVSSSQLNIATILAGGYFGVDSGTGGKVYNLTNSSVQDQLVTTGNLSLGSYEVYPVEITKASNTAYALRFMVAGTTLYASYSTPSGTTNVHTATFSSTNHKYFRIREASGTIYWETSPNGGTWTNFSSLANPFDVTAVNVGQLVGTWNTESSTTTAVFDNFNVTNPATASIGDDWNSGSIDSAKWENWGSTHVAVSSQKLNMTSTTASGYYGLDNGINGNVYNLTGSSITNQLVTAGNQSITSWEVYPIYTYDSNASNNSYYFIISGNTLKAYKQVAGTHTQLATTTYSSTNHKWFRIREAAGTTYFDTSTDGSTWTNFASTTNAFTLTSVIAGSEVGTWQTEGFTTTATFDNFNAYTPVYTYDANGNMTSDGTTCYEYNEGNQMKKVTDCNSNRTIAEYVYDLNGNRMIKKNYANGALTNTVTSWSDSYETKVIVGGTTENTTYYWVNGELTAKKNPDSSMYYYQNDHLGSANIITNSSGTLVETTTYDPWGQLIAGGTKSKFTYTGQESDSETNLMYYNARYYDPHIRRFTQPDTIVQNIYNPQMLNRYSYVTNNPLKYTDPSGHASYSDYMNSLAGQLDFIASLSVKPYTPPQVITSANPPKTIPTVSLLGNVLGNTNPSGNTQLNKGSILGTSAGSSGPAATINPSRGDDYKYADIKNTWNFVPNNCTAFAAFRLVQDRHSQPPNFSGNAYLWDNNCKTCTLTNTPKAGDIAQWETDVMHPNGHVAYVREVDGSNVWLEDYNGANKGAYDSFNLSERGESGAPTRYISFP